MKTGVFIFAFVVFWFFFFPITVELCAISTQLPGHFGLLGRGGCACSTWKNPHHSSDWSHCNDNSGSLTHCATRELPWTFFNTKDIQYSLL